MLLPQRHRVLAEIRRENLCVSLRNLSASAVKGFWEHYFLFTILNTIVEAMHFQCKTLVVLPQ